MAKESAFYNWLKTQLWDWHLQRIETTTGSGVPDVIGCHERRAVWIELKNLPRTNVQLRKAQWAWLHADCFPRCLTLILNRAPNESEISIWIFRPHMEHALTKEGHVKIVDEPDYVVERKMFRNLINNLIMTYGKPT